MQWYIDFGKVPNEISTIHLKEEFSQANICHVELVALLWFDLYWEQIFDKKRLNKNGKIGNTLIKGNTFENMSKWEEKNLQQITYEK